MAESQVVIGVDLSGPVNVADTAVSCFYTNDDGLLTKEVLQGVDDATLFDLVTRNDRSSDLVIGLDASLSYNPGGGDRPGDRSLRDALKSRGLPGKSVMPPTMTRMAYLTLRGVAVTRALSAVAPTCRVVEVHPGAALVLHGATPKDVHLMKRDATARQRLLRWLGARGIKELPEQDVSDHLLASFACAFAAWKWARGESIWLMQAKPPQHPYDYAC